MAFPKTEGESDEISSLEATVKTDLSVNDTKNVGSSITVSTSNGKESPKKVISDDGEYKTSRSASSATDEVSTTSSLNGQIGTESFSVDNQCHTNSMFGTAVKSVTKKIQVYLADSRSVKLKKHLASGILQDLRILGSCVDGLDDNLAKEMCFILMEKTIVMKKLYSFLFLMFEG